MVTINWLMACEKYWTSSGKGVLIENPLTELVLNDLSEEVHITIYISLSNYEMGVNGPVIFKLQNMETEEYVIESLELNVYMNDKVILTMPKTTFENPGLHKVQAQIGESVAKSFFNVKIGEKLNE